MTTRTVTAMFSSRADADRAAQQLASDLRVDRSAVRVLPEAGATDVGYDSARPYQETGFWASLKNLFLPDDDRYGYAEGMRRGGIIVAATVDEGQVDRASDILEHAGALDLDEHETKWRQSGWTGYDASAHGAVRPAGTATGAVAGAMGGAAAAVGNAASRTANAVTGGPARPAAYDQTTATTNQTTTNQTTTNQATTGRDLGRDEMIPIIEERLVVGKREVDRGRVRVRSYVVERPVEEQVRLHEERVTIERHPVDRAMTDMDRDAFKERTIEATATSEEAVVSKEARIVEEVSIHKEAADRTETVHDTVRRTEVEVNDDAANARAGAARGPGSVPGAAGTTGTAGTNPPGNPVTRAADRTLGTDMSGAYPQQADGTPENPRGTAASRGMDKTLGTNVSGTNPTRKP